MFGGSISPLLTLEVPVTAYEDAANGHRPGSRSWLQRMACLPRRNWRRVFGRVKADQVAPPLSMLQVPGLVREPDSGTFVI